MFLFDERYQHFQMYSIQHFGAIFVLIIFVFLLIKSKNVLQNNDKLDYLIRFSTASIMFAFEVTFWIWSIATHGFDIGLLPFGLCAMSLHLSVIALCFDSKKLFKVIYPWTITGAFLSLLVADLSYGFPHFRYFHYFINHSLFFLSTLYFLVIKKVEIKYRDILISTLVLLLLTIPISIINLIFNGNHLFLRALPADIDFLFYWMGSFWVIGFMIFIFGLFNLWFLPLKGRKL
jgi:hypothetical integral membrane protein (TIGR02206 family)